MKRSDHGGPYPFIPRGLSRSIAAFYIGVGTTLFDEMVADGRMPKPKRVNNRAIWDRAEVDAAFTDLPTGPENTLKELLKQSPKVGNGPTQDATKSDWD